MALSHLSIKSLPQRIVVAPKYYVLCHTISVKFKITSGSEAILLTPILQTNFLGTPAAGTLYAYIRTNPPPNHCLGVNHSGGEQGWLSKGKGSQVSDNIKLF